MKNNRLNFTKKALDSLPLPAPGKRSYYYDTKCRGLVLCITAAGTKSFQVYRKVNGRPQRITLGRFPELTLEQVRGQVAVVLTDIAMGIDPNERKRQARAEMTFVDFYHYYMEQHAKLHKKTHRRDKELYDSHLQGFKNCKVSSIKKQAMQQLHAKVGKNNGIYTANRLLALLHTMFNKAIAWGICQDNSAHGIQKFKEKSRDRFLQPNEFQAFFKAVAQEQNEVVRDYVLLSLLTGARRENLLTMRWEQVDFVQAIWRIPETKNGEPHSVPLVAQALEILRYRQATANSPWVFPGPGKKGHLADPKKGWQRILARAGITDLRLHDLRRTLASWQATTGASLSVIGKTLAHKHVATTQIYARLNLDPVREAMNKATAAMVAAGQEDEFD